MMGDAVTVTDVLTLKRVDINISVADTADAESVHYHHEVSSEKEAIFPKFHDHFIIWNYWNLDILRHHILWCNTFVPYIGHWLSRDQGLSWGIVALSVITAALCLSCLVITPVLATKLAGQYVALNVIEFLMPKMQQEEGKIQAWENHEKRKAKTEMKEWRLECHRLLDDGWVCLNENLG
ncbi:hypothetical protein Tco_1362644 [Tanacetum coccineum]